MNIEKMREDFEFWYAELVGLDASDIADWRRGDGYQNSYERCALSWTAWQASRQSLVIELPSLREVIYGRRDNENDSGFNSAIDLCAKAVESAGVKCEVKS